jgi:hypothetical protein
LLFEASYGGTADLPYANGAGDLSQLGGISDEALMAVLSTAQANLSADLLWSVRGTGAEQRLVVQWEGGTYSGNNSSDGYLSYQAVIFKDGRIRFNYRNLDEPRPLTSLQTGGIGATVGLWSGATTPVTVPAGRYAPGLHSFGTLPPVGNNPATLNREIEGEAVDSYIRLAWDTGGTAWDIGALANSNSNVGGGENGKAGMLLKNDFVATIRKQVRDAAQLGSQAEAMTAVLQVNVGGVASGGWLPDSALSPTTGSGMTETRSVPMGSVGLTSAATRAGATDGVVRTARVATSGDLSYKITADQNGISLPDGPYVLELLFTDVAGEGTAPAVGFSVIVENDVLLTDYIIAEDYAKVAAPTAQGDRYVGQAGSDTAIVKRFKVVARDGIDLQLKRLGEEFFYASPQLSGIRVLRDRRGDFNADGAVNGADYTVWRDTLGRVVTPGAGADVDGDGLVTQNDYLWWMTNYGATTGKVLGDYNGDGAVNIGDYNVWVAAYGTSNLAADGNGDGFVNAADYTIWQDNFSNSMNSYSFGRLLAAFGPDVPPSVVGVALGMASGVYDFGGKVGSGEQLRSLSGGHNTISFTFNQNVNVTQSALTLVNLDGGTPAVTAFSYDSQSQTATWTFSTTLADGRYLLRLADSVTDVGGEALDGEFTNPWFLTETGTDLFGSGDGKAGGEFRFRFTVLAGDTDRDNQHGGVDYRNWRSTEPGMAYVSTTADEFDGDLSFGDTSLREAVHYANTATERTTIILPTGRYTLSRLGAEPSGADTAVNDLDILANMTLLGYGAGLSIIDTSQLKGTTGSYNDYRAFSVGGVANVQFVLAGVTVANSLWEQNGNTQTGGYVAMVRNGAKLTVLDSAVVNHTGYAAATAIDVLNAHLEIRRSVFTDNDVVSNYGGTAVHVRRQGSNPGATSVAIGESIFAKNVQPGYYGGSTGWGVIVTGSGITKTNWGRNLYDYNGGGFFGTGGVAAPVDAPDHFGTADYIVTSVADTFNHGDDLEARSLREAIDLANLAPGANTIWVPAWNFRLTRDRATYGGGSLTDTSVAYGDLDIDQTLTIRGVRDATKVEWKAGIIDKVFELLGDFDGNLVNNLTQVDVTDLNMLQAQYGYNGVLGQYAADGDEDGDVDGDDLSILLSHFGNTLTLWDILA